MRGSTGRNRTRTDITLSIPTSTTPVGAVAANAFTGWISPAATVQSVTQFGSTDRYINRSASTSFLAKSAGISWNQEITFWASRARIFLRLDDTTGSCFYLQFDAFANNITIAYCTGIFDGTSDVSLGYPGGSPQNLAAFGGLDWTSFVAATGYNGADTNGDTITFGIDGFYLYCRYNGIEFFREKSYYSMKPGRIALAPRFTGNEFGFRDVSAVLKIGGPQYSDVSRLQLDVRDFGCKALSTTGSMTADSPTLTVASSTGFEIGDYVIVEVGGESGIGTGAAHRGKRGVGGQWPTLTYANQAAMDADTTQVNGKVCGLLDTGFTYQYNSGTLTWARYDTSLTYHNKILPRALMARITNKVGNTLTLNANAVVSTTNATVHINNRPAYMDCLGAARAQDVGKGAVDPSDLIVVWPAGRFAWGQREDATGLDAATPRGKLRWTMRGAGRENTTIFSPNGTLSLHWNWRAEDSIVEDIGFEANGRTDRAPISFVQPTTDAFQVFPTAFTISTSNNSTVRRIKSVDGFQQCIAMAACNNSLIDDFIAYHATGHERYTQWMVNPSDSSNCIVQNGTIEAEFLTCGLEFFRSSDCTFRNITARNICISNNSNNNWLYENIDIYLEENCQNAFGFPSYVAPFVDINSNIDYTSGGGNVGGGILRDFRLRQLGPINPDGDVLTTINISGNAKNIQIIGDYPAKPVTQPAGLIEQPAYTRGIWTVRGIRADTAVNVDVSGVRVIGSTVAGNILQVSGADSSVVNSVADSISAPSTSGNITNAAYDAL